VSMSASAGRRESRSSARSVGRLRSVLHGQSYNVQAPERRGSGRVPSLSARDRGPPNATRMLPRRGRGRARPLREAAERGGQNETHLATWTSPTLRAYRGRPNLSLVLKSAAAAVPPSLSPTTCWLVHTKGRYCVVFQKAILTLYMICMGFF
jgi:hypothetical protein